MTSSSTPVAGMVEASGAVTALPLILRLPDELLLKVASHLGVVSRFEGVFYLQEPCELEGASRLGNFHLSCLSRTSRRFRSIAQEALYRRIVLKWYFHRASRPTLSQLARTLVARLDLAGRVKQIELDPYEVYQPVKASMFLAMLNTVDNHVMQAMTVKMKETELVGILLSLLANLESLSLKYTGMVHEFDTAHDLTQELFGEDFQCDKPMRDLSRVAGLAKLRQVYLDSFRVGWEWCRLPCLKQLWLGIHCIVGDYSAYTEMSQIEILDMTCSMEILARWVRVYTHLPAFLQRLPRVTKIHLYLRFLPGHERLEEIYRSDPFLTGNHRGNFSEVMGALHQTAPTLEHLSILDTCVNWFWPWPKFVTDNIDPIVTLVHFERLKRLEILQDFLLGSRPHDTTLQAILPPSIVELALHFPSAKATEWLDNLPREKAYFSNLKHIGLAVHDCGHRQDWCRQEFDEFLYTTRDIWRQIQELGIECSVYQYPSGVREDWPDDTYDPFVSNIATFLEGLASPTG